MRGEPIINLISAKKKSAVAFMMLRVLPICEKLAVFFFLCKFPKIMSTLDVAKCRVVNWSSYADGIRYFCVNEEREVSDISLFHLMIYILIKRFTNEIWKTIIHLTL